MKADSFTVGKKKIGFFQTSLFNVARFHNAVIDFYGNVSSKNGTLGLSGDMADMTFKDAFSKDALPSLPGKGISSIIMEPVCLNLHNESSMVTQIKASSAKIRIKERSVLFQGAVEVLSGSRSMNTDRLIFLPESAVIKTDQHFILKTPEKEYNGNRITSDVFLNSVNIGTNE